MVHRQMYITGSVGSSGILERFTTDYDLPNDCNYSETCATIALAMFGKRMADIKKDASYMDVVERALYNTLLSGIAMDGKSFFYVNPLEVWPANCIPRTSKEHVKPVRQKWFGVACCPPNITRTLASLGQYIYFKDEEKIYVNLYVANETKTTIGGNEFTMKLDGDFPWNENISFKLSGEKASKGTIAFRIPEYAQGFEISHNGEMIYKAGGEIYKQDGIKIENGYIEITGEFKEEIFDIKVDSKPVFVHANPLVRADSGKTAIMKGPLVYCIEETDNGDNLASVFVDTDQKLEEIYNDKLLGGCSEIHLRGKKISDEGWNDKKLYQPLRNKYTEVELTAVPYCYWGNRQTGEMLVWIKETI